MVAHLEGEAQVLGYRIPVELGWVDHVPAQAAQHQGQGLSERVSSGGVVGVEFLNGMTGNVRCRNKVLANLLGQGLNQGRDQLLPQTRNQPFKRSRFKLP